MRYHSTRIISMWFLHASFSMDVCIIKVVMLHIYMFIFYSGVRIVKMYYFFFQQIGLELVERFNTTFSTLGRTVYIFIYIYRQI